MNTYIVEYTPYETSVTILTTAETERDAILNAIAAMIKEEYGEFYDIDDMSTIDIESIDEAEGDYYLTNGKDSFEVTVHRIVPDFKGTKILYY